MILKIKMMSGSEIFLEESELPAFLDKAKNGGLVVLRQGIVNVASIDSIIADKKKNEEVGELLKIGRSRQEAESEVLGVSPFAKILSKKMTMLSDSSRTAAQEEAAAEERKLK